MGDGAHALLVNATAAAPPLRPPATTLARFGYTFPDRPPAMIPQPARQTFTAALDTLVDQLRRDRSVLAVLLCGSLSH